ncbi:pentapeptide repeat-containing protein [Nonomuraea wenchangensis]
MWWWALPAAALVGAAVWGTSAWLLQDLSTLPVAEQISARIEAVRTALAAGAGVGAAVTLLLAVRRQRHQELATAHTTHDAAERRVTELYTKAAEQLGNAQAPVRLAGLYALERLAQDTPALRQTVVDVICSYLRMPYTPPRKDLGEKIRAAQRAARNREPARSASGGGRDPQEERQVRLTAQRILATHLRYDNTPTPRRRWSFRNPDRNPRHWSDIRLDLTGAVLLDFDLSTCRMSTAEFVGAIFTGTATFDKATFTGEARFSEATFTQDAFFSHATFTRDAWFSEATFTQDAFFSEATFTNAIFDKATFVGTVPSTKHTLSGAVFIGATFHRIARFTGTTFTQDAWFQNTTFNSAVFAGATFNRSARFSKATFTGTARFDRATGLEAARLIGARTLMADSRNHVWPPCWQTEEAADGWHTLRLAAEGEGRRPDGRERGKTGR